MQVRLIGVALLAICLLLSGCQSYTENERLNYLDDAAKVVSLHRAVVDAEPMMMVKKGSEAREVSELATSEFKGKYQGTELDDDYDLLEQLTDLDKKCALYTLAAAASELEKAVSSKATVEVEDGHQRYIEAVEKAEETIKSAR